MYIICKDCEYLLNKAPGPKIISMKNLSSLSLGYSVGNSVREENAFFFQLNTVDLSKYNYKYASISVRNETNMIKFNNNYVILNNSQEHTAQTKQPCLF